MTEVLLMFAVVAIGWLIWPIPAKTKMQENEEGSPRFGK